MTSNRLAQDGLRLALYWSTILGGLWYVAYMIGEAWEKGLVWYEDVMTAPVSFSIDKGLLRGEILCCKSPLQPLTPPPSFPTVLWRLGHERSH